MHYTSKKIFSKIYNNYGLKYYPKKFKKKIKIKKNFSNIENEILIKNEKNFVIDLASQRLKINPSNIWKKKNFKDREDLSSLHRWSWAIKLLSKKKVTNLSEKKFIEDSLINWCVKHIDTQIEKKNIIFEPYNISERICNYLILIKLQILKPNNFILKNLEKQFLFLFENIEYYKFKLSNHALNNLRAIYLFSVFTSNKKIQKYSFEFIDYLLTKFLDKNYFFKFGSSNYQFIFTKWLLDIYLFSTVKKKKDKIKRRLVKILDLLNFFIEVDKNKNKVIPLFGNISPDFENNWIIKFFSEKKENYFFKNYWKNLNFGSSKKNIRSKEWIKLKNKKFSIFLRNPKLVGFDFNHSHNDFFNFVLFYKGKKIILDPGRENYSFESLKRDISGKSHNSIFINNKAIYDDYLIYNVLYKLGLKNIKNCKYYVNTNYRDFVKLRSLEKNFTAIREIYLKNDYIEIIDKIFTKKKSNIKIQFNLNMNKKNLKENKYIELIHNSKIKNKKKFIKKNFYKSYGLSYEGTTLLVEFSNINRTKSSLKIKG